MTVCQYKHFIWLLSSENSIILHAFFFVCVHLETPLIILIHIYINRVSHVKEVYSWYTPGHLSFTLKLVLIML